eukprot:Colp12_sorted_trinity150504_noHs@3197
MPAEDKSPFLDKDVELAAVDTSKSYLFVELHDLEVSLTDDAHTRWKESSRWLDEFEERLMIDGWTKPHIPSLSYQHLRSLHNQLETGTAVFDLEASSNQELVAKLVGEVRAAAFGLSDEGAEKLVRVLMQKHTRSTDKQLPGNAECAVILAGHITGLVNSLALFAKIVNPQVGFADVAAPVKYIALFLEGDNGSEYPVRDIGRCFGTVLASHSVQSLLPNVTTKTHLLGLLHSFVKESGLIPYYDPDIVLFDEREKRTSFFMGIDEGTVTAHHDLLTPGAGSRETGFERTGKFFGGVIKDIKRRWPYYWDDMKEVNHVECYVTIAFLYIAILTPCMSFGSLFDPVTGGFMGPVETMFSAAITGMVFALFSGQPLNIIGPSAPLLAFTAALYSFCEGQGINFAHLYVWTGLWTALFCLIITAFDLSSLIGYVTGFTRDIYSVFISLLYCWSSLEHLWETYAEAREYYVVNGTVYKEEHGVVERAEADDFHEKWGIALISTLLMFLCFFVTGSVKHFKFTDYLKTKWRKFIANFAYLIGMGTAVAFYYIFTSPVVVPKLKLPAVPTPTHPELRDWFINPFEASPGVVFGALVPAILNTILIFVSQQLCALICNSQKGVTKGPGYHLDLLIISIMVGFQSLFGMPWLVGAPVRAMAHIGGLTLYKKTVTPGAKPEIDRVIETRLTGFFVHFFIAISMFFSKLLGLIPIPVLWGVFLFMGSSSLPGVDFWERVKLLFIPAKRNHPDTPYRNTVSRMKTHSYTIVQLVCFITLFAITTSPAGIGFPFVLVMILPVRMFLIPRFWTPAELKALDGN